MSLLTSLRAGFLKRHFDSAQIRFPYLYWIARNKTSLAQWYWHKYVSRHSQQDFPDHYDTDFWDFHDSGDWDGFARVVLNSFAPESILDIGCGQGKAIEAFQKAKPTLRVKGLDYSQAALARAKAKGLTVSRLDIVTLRNSEVRALFSQLGIFDLVICLEVAEHIPSWHVGKLLQLLSGFDRIIFSAAHPNQGGLYHVNEQWPEYWIQKFRVHGFDVADNNEEFRSEIKELDLPFWYARNLNIFVRRR